MSRRSSESARATPKEAGSAASAGGGKRRSSTFRTKGSSLKPSAGEQAVWCTKGSLCVREEETALWQSLPSKGLPQTATFCTNGLIVKRQTPCWVQNLPWQAPRCLDTRPSPTTPHPHQHGCRKKDRGPPHPPPDSPALRTPPRTPPPPPPPPPAPSRCQARWGRSPRTCRSWASASSAPGWTASALNRAGASGQTAVAKEQVGSLEQAKAGWSAGLRIWWYTGRQLESVSRSDATSDARGSQSDSPQLPWPPPAGRLGSPQPFTTPSLTFTAVAARPDTSGPAPPPRERRLGAETAPCAPLPLPLPRPRPLSLPLPLPLPRPRPRPGRRGIAS